MKTIENKSTHIFLGDSEKPMKFSDLAKRVVNQQPTQGGITVAEMRERMRLLDQIEKSGDGAIVLEDADHKKLVSLCGTMPWAFAHPDIIAFVDAVEAQSATVPVTPQKNKMQKR